MITIDFLQVDSVNLIIVYELIPVKNICPYSHTKRIFEYERLNLEIIARVINRTYIINCYCIQKERK
jgi:hypothetical protein